MPLFQPKYIWSRLLILEAKLGQIQLAYKEGPGNWSCPNLWEKKRQRRRAEESTWDLDRRTDGQTDGRMDRKALARGSGRRLDSFAGTHVHVWEVREGRIK